MLHHISADVDSDITCNDDLGGKCQLSKSCSDSAYTDLWSYSFKFQFNTDAMYTTVGLGSFAIDDTTNGVCNLYIQLNSYDSVDVILGSMFLQNFNTLWTEQTDGSQQLQLMVSSLNSLPWASIDSVAPGANDQAAFSYSPSPLVVPVFVDPASMSATITANLGYQGPSQFMPSLSSNIVSTWSKNCTGPGLDADQCSSAPNYA